MFLARFSSLVKHDWFVAQALDEVSRARRSRAGNCFIDETHMIQVWNLDHDTLPLQPKDLVLSPGQ